MENFIIRMWRGMSKNDDKILLLKKQIEEKKQDLGANVRFNPITNCSIDLDGNRYNLNALQKESHMYLLVKLNSLLLSVKDLKIDVNSFIISGYNITEWMTDIESKIKVLNRKEKELELRNAEAKLDKLLSDDKKVELELENIENMLK